tara:strand:- start:234 stop:446 length:213 start_codon:yes stop_codon:yes gene_type:complete
VSIDISLYPLNEKFIPPIDDFISNLKKYDNIGLRTNSMSTQLFGEFDDLMIILKIEIEIHFEKEINSVLN